MWLFFLLPVPELTAQPKADRFAMIDNRVKTIDKTNPDSLAKELTSPYKKDAEKVRSVFRWITEHIAYDTKGYHNAKGPYEGLWELSLTAGAAGVRQEYNERIIEQVLRTKLAVCDGYARLFKSLCDRAGINCMMITGYIRWASDPIGSQTQRTHAWNAVEVDGSWKLIDATWASGYTDQDVTTYTKAYNEFFFFTDPVQFFNDHYPMDQQWSLMARTPSLSQFYQFPFYYPAFYSFSITDVKPVSGWLKVSRKDRVVQVELAINERVKDFFLYETPRPVLATDSTGMHSPDTAISAAPSPKYRIENGRIYCIYRLQSLEAKKLHAVLNGKRILTYDIQFVSDGEGRSRK